MPTKRTASQSPDGRLLAVLALLAAAGCARCGTKEQGTGTAPPMAVASATAELATLDLPGLGGAAPAGAEAQEVEAFVNQWGTGGAFVVRSPGGARLVRGTTVSPPYERIESVTISPDGRRVAFVILLREKYRVVLDGDQGPEVDAVEGPVFTRDGRHLFYRARTGEAWRLVADGTLGEERFRIGEGPMLGPDGSTVRVVEQASASSPPAVVSYDADLRRTVLKELAAEVLVLSRDASHAAAVSAVDGKKRASWFELARPDSLQQGALYDEIPGLAFDPTGRHVMHSALLGDKVHLVLDGKAEEVPAPSIVDLPVLDPVSGRVGVVLVTDRPFFHLVFDARAPKAKQYDSVTDIVFSADGSRHAYVAEEGSRSLVVVNGSEGPRFDRVVMPRFSPDSAFLVYRARQDGRRFVVVADADGKVLRRQPDYEQVFQPEFTADGKSVAYAVKEGPRLVWKVERL